MNQVLDDLKVGKYIRTQVSGEEGKKLKLDQEKVWRSYYKPSNLESFDHNNVKVELCNKKCRKIPPQ